MVDLLNKKVANVLNKKGQNVFKRGLEGSQQYVKLFACVCECARHALPVLPCLSQPLPIWAGKWAKGCA